MRTKIKKTYTWKGLGWPIVLTDVTFVYFENEWHPKIDVEKEAKITMLYLVTKKKLTKPQKRFVRSYFNIKKEE